MGKKFSPTEKGGGGEIRDYKWLTCKYYRWSYNWKYVQEENEFEWALQTNEVFLMREKDIIYFLNYSVISLLLVRETKERWKRWKNEAENKKEIYTNLIFKISLNPPNLKCYTFEISSSEIIYTQVNVHKEECSLFQNL